MLADLRVDKFAAMRLEALVCAFFVGTHQPAIASNIGGEDGGQPAFDASRGQSGAPKPHRPKRLSALEPYSNGKRERRHFLSMSSLR